MLDETIVLPEVTKRILDGQRFTQARLSRDGLTVRCGFRKCDGVLGKLVDRGTYRELVIDAGWASDDGIHWRLTRHNERRVTRGWYPKPRKGYVNPGLVRAANETGQSPVSRQTLDGPVSVPMEEALAPVELSSFVHQACFVPCPKEPLHGVNYLDPAILGYVTQLQRLDLYLSDERLSADTRDHFLALREALLANQRCDV